MKSTVEADTCPDMDDDADSAPTNVIIPTQADFFFAHACPPGEFSF